MWGVFLLLKSRKSHLDFSKATPHVSTHPYTTFDHSSRMLAEKTTKLVALAHKMARAIWTLMIPSNLTR